AVRVSFPVYDSLTGKIVSKYLQGEFGPPDSIDSKIASTWYALNRLEHEWLMEPTEEDNSGLSYNRTVVCDRYVESNMGHQGGKIADPKERVEFFKWCEKLEYGDLELRRPDVGVFLHVPWQVSTQLIKSRGRRADGHEADEKHLQMAEQAYLQLADVYNWIVIECVNNGQLRERHDIASEIWGKLSNASDGDYSSSS
ncbi:MAG: hypothetical protein QF535_20270, partial [Anaerolineales bacterium]|nr:hypothetical protein [Anaerolineales bacterium]